MQTNKNVIMEIGAITKRLPEYKKVYHDYVIPQHLQYYFMNRQHDQSESIKNDASAYSTLNQANLILGKYFRTVINHSNSLKWLTPELVNGLNQLIDEWHKLYKEGRVYNTFSYAEKIYKVLSESSYPLQSEIDTNTNLLNAFVNISYVVKTAFQIEVWVRDIHLHHFLEDSISFLGKSKSLAYYFKEMTISHSAITKLLGAQHASFYNLKFKLVPEIVNTYRNPMVNEAIGAIIKWNEGLEDIEINKRAYTLEISNNVSVSQGNYNYKKFLDLINLLPQVYDRNFGFAYLLNK